jgi:glycosyltransferase involved in cell wall biosynthesis
MVKKTVLFNFAVLDPPRNGGTSRIGLHAARLMISLRDVRTVFAVNTAFAARFEHWLGAPACVVPMTGGGYYGERQAARIARTLKPDFIISPLFGMEPFHDMDSSAHIVGMPDTLALDHPEMFSAHDAAYRRKAYDRLSKAERVVTISQFAARQLRMHLALPEDRVDVVMLAGDSATSDAGGQPPLTGRYWLYPANAWPHKRHDLLLRAFSLARQRDPLLTLALTGDRDSFTGAYGNMLASLGLDEQSVRHLGYVSNDALMALYRHAQALVFTSAYEGFGMPLLEAMHAGCPVVCAPLTAVPEVAGEAALYVADDTPEGWARAVLDELPGRRDALIAAGRARAGLFTWERMRSGWHDVLVRAGLPAQADGAPAYDGGFRPGRWLSLPGGRDLPMRTRPQRALSLLYLRLVQGMAISAARTYLRT